MTFPQAKSTAHTNHLTTRAGVLAITWTFWQWTDDIKILSL